MKMVKKILLGTLALAAVLALTSCGEKQDEEKAFNGENINLPHDGTSGDYYRSFASTKTKHYSADAKITIEDADNYSPKKADGTSFKDYKDDVLTISAKAGFGFVFGLEEVTSEVNKNHAIQKNTYKENGDFDKKVDVKFYTFGIAAVRWNAALDKPQWYVEWCTNVPDTVFNYNNSTNFDDTTNLQSLNPSATIPVHTPSFIVPSNDGWKDVDKDKLKLDDNGNLVAVIKTIANDDGSYKVILCDANGTEIENSGEKLNKSITGFVDDSGNGKKVQKLIGRYITVYKGQTAKGTIEYSDISGNVIPADYDVVIE